MARPPTVTPGHAADGSAVPSPVDDPALGVRLSASAGPVALADVGSPAARALRAAGVRSAVGVVEGGRVLGIKSGDGERILAAFSVPSEPRTERAVVDRVVAAAEPIGLGREVLDRMRTAVAEAAMNAIEHGNGSDPSLEVGVGVIATDVAVTVAISDLGGDRAIDRPADPDIHAKLRGEQSPRGWGLFLIEKMVDRAELLNDERGHVCVLTFTTEGADA